MKIKKFIQKNKVWAIPIVWFFVGCLFLEMITNNLLENHLASKEEISRMNAITYAEQIKEDINAGISITNSLKQVIVSEDGRCNAFDEIARNSMNSSIQSIQLAPAGKVTEIYPEAGNEAGKVDLMTDEARGAYARYGMEQNCIVTQGPFDLRQGGKEIAIRNPVYLEKDGQKVFWGFTIAIIRVPDIFSKSAKALENFGYQYRLLKNEAPWSKKYTDVAASKGKLVRPVAYTFKIGQERWKLEVMPKDDWQNKELELVFVGGGLFILLLMTGLMIAVLILNQRRKNLHWLAQTDALTNVYNRSGFDQVLDQHIEAHANFSFVVAKLDIDNFKFINDMYGHAAGDLALQSLTHNMRKAFLGEAIIGRNGGDEFCLLLPDTTCQSVQKKLEKFTKTRKSFVYKGKLHFFTISLGYAEYPTHAVNRNGLMQCADAALYGVKQKGKQGCMVFTKGLQATRTQLGFALQDISDNLPGAFLIYKANPADDQLLFANHEMLELAGCKDMDEFFAYTKCSFRNLIDEPERDAVEASIWQQINADNGHKNDYVSFSFIRRDGSKIEVFDHGRIVDTTHYGRVFYVLFMSKELINRHYERD